MDSDPIARSTYRGSTVVHRLTGSTTFSELCSYLCSRFKLKLGFFYLRYSLPDSPNCMLDSDKHLSLVQKVLRILKLQIFDIAVKDVEDSSVVIDRVVEVQDCYSSVYNDNGYLDKLRNEGQEKYPLKEWKEYDEQNEQRFEGGVNDTVGYESSGSNSIDPPFTKRQVGRPKTKTTISTPGVSKRPIKCGCCGKVGHNKRTCNVSTSVETWS